MKHYLIENQNGYLPRGRGKWCLQEVVIIIEFDCNRLMGMCRWMRSQLHDWIDYTQGCSFIEFQRMGSHIFGIFEVLVKF